MKVVLSFFIVLFSFAGSAFAHETPFMGRLTDERNKPVPNTAILINVSGRDTTVMTNEFGLYSTLAWSACELKLTVKYKHQTYKAKVSFTPSEIGKINDYHHLKMAPGKILVTKNSSDPFLVTALKVMSGGAKKEPVVGENKDLKTAKAVPHAAKAKPKSAVKTTAKPPASPAVKAPAKK